MYVYAILFSESNSLSKVPPKYGVVRRKSTSLYIGEITLYEETDNLVRPLCILLITIIVAIFVLHNIIRPHIFAIIEYRSFSQPLSYIIL